MKIGVFADGPTLFMPIVTVVTCEVDLNDDFDMYSELLGLPVGPRPPDYYTLLGVAPSETDAAQIHAAAKRRITRLSSLLHSERAKFAQHLIGEIATARAVLTTPEVKARYDAKLRQPADAAPAAHRVPAAVIDSLLPPTPLEQTVTMPELPKPVEDCAPQPTVAGTARWAKPVSAPPEPPSAPDAAPVVVQARLIAGPGAAFQAKQPSAADWLPPTLSDTPPLARAVEAGSPMAWPATAPSAADTGLVPAFDSPRTTRMKATARQRQNSHVTLIAVLACSLVALLVIGAGALLASRSQQRELALQENHAANDATIEVTTDARPRPRRRGVAGDRLPDSASARPLPAELGNSIDDSLPNSTSQRERKAEKPKSANKSLKMTATTANDNAAMSPATERPPQRTAVAQPSDAVVDSAQTKLVEDALLAARQALAARDLDKADEQLDLALLEASADSLREKVKDVKTLRHFVGGFWNAVHKRLQSLVTGTELVVGEETMIVVEVHPDDDLLVVRRRGANVDYTRQQLPTDLAVVLAEQWLADDDVNSPVFVGAFLATSPQKEDVERGRRILAEAKAAGSEAAASVLAQLGQ
jgi:hypothetical protein